ncbi:MAG: fibronectin type III domain-containing protein [Saprospiraceae bacterium]|nr:fibronectin type III domain-containing protein [Saprospiraceae bacterium]
MILAILAFQATAQNTCATAVAIASVPFSSGAQTTCGTVNDYAAGFSTCVSSNYGGGEDYVYSINITTAPVTYTLNLGGAATWKIASVHSACPPAGANCVGGIATSSGTSASGNVTFPSNGTYYIIIDTWPAPTCGGFTLDITPPPPPPANDLCPDAIAFPAIPTNGDCADVTVTTVAATGSADPVCSGTEDDDVWYTFTTPAGVTSLLYTNTNISGSADRALQIYSGTCAGLTSIGCYDPESGTLTGLTGSTTYYLRAYTWGTGVTTTFNLCLRTTPPPPANDNCASATVLTPSAGGVCTPVAGTTNAATQSIAAILCGGFTASTALDVWYSFTATSTSHNVVVVGDVNFDAVIDVRSGPCNGINIACADATIAGGTETAALTGLTVGQTYLVRVYDFFGTASFTICVNTPIPPCNAPGTPTASNITPNSASVSWAAASGALTYDWTLGTGASCPTGTGANTAATSLNLTGLTPNTTYRVCVRTGTCGGGAASGYVTTTFTTAPLPNDNCAGAQTITCGSTINGSTVGAASDAGVGSCGIGTGGTPGNGVWYKLVGNGAQVTASLCASAYDTKLHVYTGSCAGLTCLVSNDDSPVCGNTRSQVVFNANVGTDYYILVSGFSTNTGAFSLNLACLCGPALGAPWTTTNIGASNGGAIENVCDGTIDVRATNYGSPTNDVQTYAWQQLCGNGFIKAKVENVTNGGWGGIMFRENNAGGSRKVALRTQLTSTVIRDLRATTNGFAQSQQFPRPNTPQWLRLTRNGHVFVGETSLDGVNWDYTFSVTLVLPSCIEVGLFAQSINVNTTTTAVFSNVMGVPLTPPVIPLVGGNAPELNVAELDFSLFPNPAQSEINVKMGEEFMGKDVTVRISNQLGQTVLTRRLGEVQNQVENIQLNNLPDGMYIMTLQTEGSHSLTKKFIVGLNRP